MCKHSLVPRPLVKKIFVAERPGYEASANSVYKVCFVCACFFFGCDFKFFLMHVDHDAT